MEIFMPVVQADLHRWAHETPPKDAVFWRSIAARCATRTGYDMALKFAREAERRVVDYVPGRA